MWRGMAAAFAAMAIATVPAAATFAAEVDPAAAKFGAREAVGQMSLSPDGTKLAYIAPFGKDGGQVIVADLLKDGEPRTVLTSSRAAERVRSCEWSTNTRLTCGMYIIRKSDVGRLGFTRMLAVNADGSGLKMLTAGPTDASAVQLLQNGGGIIDWTADGAPGSVLMTRTFLPEMTESTAMASDAMGLGVEAVDTMTLARRIVEPPRPDATEYISDGHGQVRIMGVRGSTTVGYLKSETVYFYRKPGSRAWLQLSKVNDLRQGFDPFAVDPQLNVAYGFDVQDGRRALFRVALDGSLKRELVVLRADVDVDGLIRVGRQRRVVGASYAVERRETQFFDPELKQLGESLSRALPGAHNLVFVDASADERLLLLFVGSDADPGRYYLYDKQTRHLDGIAPVRPQLAGVPLAAVKPITYKAADGTLIPAYLTLPPGREAKGLRAIVMPHGGPGARDEWGFDWLSQYFAARGYAVLQPNFRGSTGYGEAWFQKNGFQSWRTAIGDVNDAGRYLLSAGIAVPGKVAIVGWSYGGYAALQSAVLDPDLYKAIVAVAPVTDLPMLRDRSRNFTNFKQVATFLGTGPHLREGSPAENAARIKAPVLMFHGDQDQNVDIGQSRLMAARLRGAGAKPELVEYHGLDHQLEDDAVRAELLSRADAFLRAALGD